MEELPELRSLDLSHNKLSELPISIYFNQDLKTLRVGHNRLRGFPFSSPGANSSLSQQDYMDLLRSKGAPVLGVGYINALTELDASGNGLEHLPHTLEDCAQLRVLRLGGNQLGPELEKRVENLEELRVLDLSENGLGNLAKPRPPPVENGTAAAAADAAGEAGDEDDEGDDDGDKKKRDKKKKDKERKEKEMAKKKKKKKGKGGGGDGDEDDGGGLAALVNLKELYLQGNPDMAFLPNLGLMKALLRLDLGRCGFEDAFALADSLSGLASLEWLSVRENGLTRLPLSGVTASAEKGKKGGDGGGGGGGGAKRGRLGGKGGGDEGAGFPALTFLDASHNKMYELGSALPPALLTVDLSHNLLMELPDTQLALCSRLRTLFAHHNRIGKVPDGMGKLYVAGCTFKSFFF